MRQTDERERERRERERANQSKRRKAKELCIIFWTLKMALPACCYRHRFIIHSFIRLV
jgi:hypothetical protein